MGKWSVNRNLFLHKEYLSGSVSSHEGEFLSELVELFQPGVIVEIGSWIGASAVYLGQAVKEYGGRIYSIDPHSASIVHKLRRIADTEPIFRENLKRFEVQDVVEVIRAISMEALELWSRPIDMLFIDGLHFFKNTREDYLGWSPWVRSNGIVAFHDYLSHAGPTKVVDQIIRPSGIWEELGCVQKLIAFRRRR